MDVFLVRDDTEHIGHPTFIREGLIVPNVDAPRTRAVRALVTIDNLPLAEFLRDAENPSHTEWQHEGSNFRGKYKTGPSDLAFVKRIVYEIVQVLSASENIEDRTALIDFFSLPPPPEEEPVETPQGRKPVTVEPPVPPRPPRIPPWFRIEKNRGGFAILPATQGWTPPRILDIHVAYDVRRGNPIKRYRTADFRVNAAPIKLDPPPMGMDILECTENRILVRIVQHSFGLHVTGFDERRDLYVKAVPVEDAHGDSAI
jgi:hypothetical protein